MGTSNSPAAKMHRPPRESNSAPRAGGPSRDGSLYCRCPLPASHDRPPDWAIMATMAEGLSRACLSIGPILPQCFAR